MSEGPRLSAIVLAAGQGTRMRSERPKPIHRLCGRTMVGFVISSLADLDVERAVIVVGHGAEAVRKAVLEEAPPIRLEFVEQAVQRGTGDAVIVGLTGLVDDVVDDDELVLVLPGDTPLLRPSTIGHLVHSHRSSGVACTVLTARLADPSGYGRIVRGRDDKVLRIVEQADASPEEAAIDEINTGIFCFRRSVLGPALRRLDPENAQGEYYLTDVIEVLADMGYSVATAVADDPDETHGVNDRAQLAAAEAELRRRTNEAWLARGVTMLDPSRTYIDTTVEIANDVTLFPGTILQGRTRIARGCRIGPDTMLLSCDIGADSVIEKTVGERAQVGIAAIVGPFSHLPPNSVVSDGTVTGAFYTANDGSRD